MVLMLISFPVPTCTPALLVHTMGGEPEGVYSQDSLFAVHDVLFLPGTATPTVPAKFWIPKTEKFGLPPGQVLQAGLVQIWV